MSRSLLLRAGGFLIAALLCALQCARAQSNQPVAANTNQARASDAKVRAQEVRAACIQGRHYICGRVLEVTKQGIVVDSGYTSLLQPPFNHSWVLPAETAPKRPANLLETPAPDSPCVGLVFLTDIPRRPPVHQYDYVVIHGFPAGMCDYKPLPGVSKKIRRFSAGLEKAVALNLSVNDQ